MFHTDPNLSWQFMTSRLIEEAAKQIPSTPMLVNLVSKRVKQLTMGHRPMVDTTAFMSYGDIALTEIIEGKIGFDEPIALDDQ